MDPTSPFTSALQKDKNYFTEVNIETDLSAPIPSTHASLDTTHSNKNHTKLHIFSHGKIRTYVGNTFKALKLPYSSVVLWGEGTSINKTVTVAEIVKRKLTTHQLNFEQVNQIGQLQLTKTYLPTSKKDKLDIFKSILHTPYISITLRVFNLGTEVLLLGPDEVDQKGRGERKGACVALNASTMG
ncbi:hypothetical protein HMI54_010294 [Coelomomyces lativittatus]|nr:hypothetical protein HMI56_007535 [Coelomomyces lativittatus]KAJ1516237.1 hypothetical protein HMI54_010294 [Coelomomyces lativittatus]KAJ1517186.1 hypothetical protein HMI55_000431 [Coelomomyces lativittatus]